MKKLLIIALLFQGFLCAQESRLLPNYQKIEKDGRQIHILDISPKHFTIKAIRAQGEEAKEPVLAILKRINAIAGINGGFFHLAKDGKASPAGALKINEKWLGYAFSPRAAIAWNEKGEVLIERILTRKYLRHRRQTIEVIPLIDKTLANKKKWNNMPNILGGTPLLIYHSKMQDYSVEKTLSSFIKNRHARTAVCIKPNKHWIFVVSAHTKDADRSYVSAPLEGFTIPELSLFLKHLGCVDALNLDGGGSSTLVLNQQILSLPAGDRDPLLNLYHERSVSDVLAVFPR